MTVVQVGNDLLSGLAADTKPTTGYPAGIRFVETDTAAMYSWNGTSWILAVTPSSTTTLTNKTISARTNTLRYVNPMPNCGRWGRLTLPTFGEGLLGGSTSAGLNLGQIAGTSTQAPIGQFQTTATSGTAGGWRQSAWAPFHTARNTYFRFKFNLNQDATNSGFWCGLATTAPYFVVTGEPLPSLSGIIFGFNQGATNFDIRQNNATATSYSNLTSTASFPVNAISTAVSAGITNLQIVEIWTTDNGAHFQYSLNGAAPFTLATTQLPANTTLMGASAAMTNTTTTNCFWRQEYFFETEDPSTADTTVGLY